MSLIYAVMKYKLNSYVFININYIEKIIPLPGGKLKVLLKTGDALEASDRQSVKLKKLVKT